jgi:hypothetical protein
MVMNKRADGFMPQTHPIQRPTLNVNDVNKMTRLMSVANARSS